MMTEELDCALNDVGRLSALARTTLMGTEAERNFDRLTRLAARLVDAPVILLSLVNHDLQFFKSAIGLPEPLASTRQTPLSHSFCKYVVQTGKPLVIEDARSHPLVCDNPAIAELGVAAYLGMPLVTADGHRLGSFCAIDTRPRHWSAEARENLRDLADSVMTEIELRLAAEVARQQSEDVRQERDKNAALLASTAEGLYGMDWNGLCTFLNPAASRLIGYSASEVLGRNMHDLIHHHRPDGTPYPQEECPIFHAMRAGQPMRLTDELLWRQEGTSFPAEYSAAPLGPNGTDGAVVAFRDITERKQAEIMLREARQRDKNIAETLQRALIRDSSTEQYGPIQVASFYQAAWSEAQVGGDYFDVFPLDENRLAVVVGDASGKGLTAAVRTAEVKFSLRAFLREYPQPSVALARVNDYVCDTQRLEGRPDDAFVSLALAVVDVANNSVTFAVAGAEPPLILRSGGAAETISARGVPLGIFARQEYESLSLPFDEGDTLLIATDGLTEARAGGEFLGYEGLVRLATEAAAHECSLHEMGQSILERTREFAQGSLHDDACLILVQRS